MSSDQWKMAIMAGLVALSAALSGCGGETSSLPVSSQPVSVTQEAPPSQPAARESPAAEEPAASEEAPAAEGGVELVSRELGFAVTLPEVLRGRMGQTTLENNGITTLIISYEGESGTANLFSFDRMDTETYEKLKAEGGPVGDQLGVSEDGRVVLFNGPQSNPFEPGTADYQAMEDLPGQLGIVRESFRFLEASAQGEGQA